jgi:N-methylhydantoinase B
MTGATWWLILAERSQTVAIATRRDPLTYELVKHALAGIADSMAVTIVRTARSFVVKQSMDFSTALCDAHGELAAQGMCVPLHLGAMTPALRGVLERYRDSMAPGDMFILNDPYHGGSHLPDIFLFKPLFVEGELLAFTCVIAHQTDIGGRVSGGNACDNTEIYQEGLRLPPLRLYSRGEPNEAIFDILATNVRVPEKVLGDVRAQIAALHMGEREFRQLVAEYGASALRAYMRDILDDTERFTRDEIAALPDGIYPFTEYLDDDGIDPDPIRIELALTIKGDRITADFTGTSPQCKGSIQPNFPATKAMVYAAIRCVLSPDIPYNGGFFRPIDVIAPEGSFVNPQHPAAVAARALGARRVAQTVFGALTQALPGKIFAAWGGGEFGISIGGYYANRKPFVHLEFHNDTSWGGGPDKDGLDGQPGPMSNLANTPIELLEAEQPIRIEQYGFVADTGGAGTYRGGLSVMRDFRILQEATLQIRSDRRKFRPYGLYGGKPGTPASGVLNPDTDPKEMPSKFLMTAQPGDLYRLVLAGGGGYGDPLERDPERVAADVREEKLSLDYARQEYGVVLDAVSLEVDAEATAALRQQMDQQKPPGSNGTAPC